MTLEQLLDPDNLSALEKLTPEQLDNICMKYWIISRPSMAEPLKKNTTTKRTMGPVDLEKQAKLNIAIQQAKALGIDISKLKLKL